MSTIPKKKRFRLHREDVELTVLALPAAIWFLLFSYLPMVGIIIAFKNYKIDPHHGFLYNLFNSQWSGLDNFEFLFRTPDARRMIVNTLSYNIIFIILGTLLPIILALMFHEMRSAKLKKATQTAIFLPHFLSWVVVNYFVFAFLSPDKGLVNQIITSTGGTPISWYNKPDYWPFIFIFMNTWKGVGYGSVIYLAALSGIDGTFYEAAMIDGATKWQQMKFITLPQLKSLVIIMLIMSLGGIFRSNLDLFYQLTRRVGALYDVSLTIDVYVFNATIGSGNFKLGTAANFLQSVVGFIFVIGSNLFIRKVEPESALF